MGIDPERLLYQTDFGIDAWRGEQLATKTANVYLTEHTKALGDGKSATAKRKAHKAALAVTTTRIATQVVTENAEAFNRVRDGAEVWGVHLYKMWDAWLDKRTCPVCRKLDGWMIPRGEKWRDPVTRQKTRPGKVHPNCRCIEEFLTIAEARSMGLRRAA